MSNILRGYTGIYRSPMPFVKYSSTLYVISDSSLGEVDILPLTTGCYHDMYLIIQKLLVSNPRIRIFPMTTQYDHISDIHNIMTCPAFESLDIHWVFPTRPSLYTSEDFEIAQIKDSAFTNESEPTISFKFIPSGIDDLYDIIIYTPEKVEYFSQYVTQEKLTTLINDSSINFIHIPFSAPYYGGISAIEAFEKSMNMSKILADNFNNQSEVQWAYMKFNNGTTKERWIEL